MYTLLWLIVCPSISGNPATRRRKIMWLLKHGSLTWHRCIKENAAEVFQELFGMPCTLRGDTFYAAPSSHVTAFKQRLAAKRFMPLEKRSGSQWSGFQLLPQGLEEGLSGTRRAPVTEGYLCLRA